jgi:hypothetical protein
MYEIYQHEIAQYRRDQQTQKRERLARIVKMGHAPLRHLLSRLVTPNSAVSVLGALITLPLLPAALI